MPAKNGKLVSLTKYPQVPPHPPISLGPEMGPLSAFEAKLEVVFLGL